MRTLLLSILSLATAGAAEFTVAPGGPLSLAEARDAARKLEPGTPKKMVVRGGSYFLDQALVFDSRDNGLTIQAAPGEKPVLYGGRKITGWKRDGKFWAAEVPQAWDFRMLTVNGRFCRRARFPETGKLKHASEFKVKWMGTNGGGWERKPTSDELTTMVYREGDIGPWFDTANAELTIYHMWDESMVRVASHDPASRTIRFASPSGHPPGAFGVKDYVVWNVREGMTKPGQWYLDHTARKVVYWPLPGEDMASAEAIAPVLESILKVEGSKDAPVKGVTVRGLGFAVTNTPATAGGFGAGKYQGAVSVRFAENCALQGITVFNTAGQGIKADNTVSLKVSEADVHETGASGIVVRGDQAELTDNLVHDIGVVYPSALGIACGGKSLQVLHNEVHDTPYTAINCGGTGHRIEGNLIYRAMMELHDGAAFYTIFGRDIQIRGNLVRDIPETGGYGSSAYYLDELSENCTVEGNVSINVARPTHNHIGRKNFIRNNVFIHDGDMVLTFPRSAGYVVEKNVMQATGEIVFKMPVEAIESMPANIFHSGTGKVTVERMAEYGAKGRAPLELRDGSVFADPRLDTKKPGRYTFLPGSDAEKLGIKPVDVSGAGRRKSTPTQ